MRHPPTTAAALPPDARRASLGLALFLSVALAGAQACEMRVRRHADPQVMARMPNGELSGPQFETVKEVLRRMGCTVKPMDLPWARALSDLQTGQLDILAGAHRLPERDAYARFSETVWPARNRLFMRSAELTRLAPRDLRDFQAQGLRLGLQTGVSYGPELESLIAEGRLTVLRAPSRRGLWQMLARGRVDGVPADALSSLRELQQLGLQAQLQASAVVLEGEASRTAFSRQTVDAGFVARFDDTMRSLQRDGSLAAIERRFRELLAQPPLSR